MLGWKSGPDRGSSWELLPDHGFAGSVHFANPSAVALDGLCEGEEGDIAISRREHGQHRWRRVDLSRRVGGGGSGIGNHLLWRVVVCLRQPNKRDYTK